MSTVHSTHVAWLPGLILKGSFDMDFSYVYARGTNVPCRRCRSKTVVQRWPNISALVCAYRQSGSSLQRGQTNRFDPVSSAERDKHPNVPVSTRGGYGVASCDAAITGSYSRHEFSKTAVTPL